MTFKSDLNLDFACKCFGFLVFFLQKEKYWLGQHHLVVWTLWTLLSPPRYYIFLHLTLETQLFSETWNSQVEETQGPVCSQGRHSSPWTQVWIPQCTSPTTGKGKDTARESTTCPSSSHKEPSVQLLLNPAPFGSVDLHQFTVSWASPQDWECQPGRAGNTRGTLQLGGTSCVMWAQPLGTAWCWHTESSPLLPLALDKLLLSPRALPDLPVESSRALAEYRLVLKALQRKGEYNKHSLTAFGDRKNYFQSLCL